jgi:hypothetical protein
MTHWFFRLALLAIVAFSSVGLASCASNTQTTPILTDAAFRVIDLVLDHDDVFTVAQDSILLSDDAIKLVKVLNANQNPPTKVKTGHIQVSIIYNKRGVEAQDVYTLDTGKASLGILLQGGETFESFSGSSVNIDATHTKKITIVPLQKATSKFTVSATKIWQNTGIFLKRGKTFEVKYLSGTWTSAKGVIGTSDAAGQPINPRRSLLCNCGEPLVGFSIQALVGRIGGGVGFAPLPVGDDFSGVAYDNEFLYLRINLSDQLLSHASGAVTVSITTNNN